jgi:hypothetical protein
MIGGVGVLKQLSITSALGGLVGWLVGIHFSSVDGDEVHHLASRRAYTTC